MPRQLAEFASAGDLQQHVLVRLDTEHILSTTLKVGNYIVLPSDKLSCLLFLLKDVIYSPFVPGIPINLDTRPLPWDVSDSRGLTQGYLGFSKRQNLFLQDPAEEDAEGGEWAGLPLMQLLRRRRKRLLRLWRMRG